MRTIIFLMTTCLVVLSTVLTGGCAGAPTETQNANTESAAQVVGKPDSVELIYFHTKIACHCMSTVQDNIKYAIDTYFANETATGKVKLTMVVSDDPANAEIVNKYDAMAFVLFIKEKHGEKERIYPVSDIWNMTGDDNRDKLINFIRVTVNDILDGKTS
ncbi:MAG: hypothetical protein NTZ34_07350 [Chloroflexi bacterium]|nr:hypothetical protein [Chloroflexota bacterium]